MNKINLQKTLDKAGISQYRLAKTFGRQPDQINRWCTGAGNMGRMWKERLTHYFNENKIEIFYEPTV
jgi:plasmid maintenance system antidote protein VapI